MIFHVFSKEYMRTNEEKLDSAKKSIFKVWDTLVPDYPVEDEYYQQIGATAERLIDDIEEMQTFVDDFNHYGNPKWNPDLA